MFDFVSILLDLADFAGIFLEFGIFLDFVGIWLTSVGTVSDGIGILFDLWVTGSGSSCNENED